ncbi:histidine phosphatase family protein [Roseobacter sp. CCS2]|uniref:histidine phosphatase family protein n=1 Tax=Roseobacter sp. CCS2 TaxID=391593 RepID=UPI0000F3C5EE|nr:histidine phosphatase family protein [Roseobacter sp. CCS2]EBA11640.1 phosphoglycerate mutase, putative [Roseobacter sp. CCS2]
MIYPELYILRHGETIWNAEHRMQGELNSPLTEKGMRDAARQGAILSGINLNGFTFLSSPQGRAFQTAGIALAGIADHIRTDDRLREIGVGDWSGLLRDILPSPQSPHTSQYEIAPNGEGFPRLKLRCRAFLADLQGPAVLVTHGITSSMIRGLVVGEKAHAVPDTHGGQGRVYHLKDGDQFLLE